ncbi:hypothetical protein AB8O64_30685 [Streptomyces sp. QH1-20]|uniref:hypothetical protein n=1 Tax=Streptomyces sp. QH1-20 TaxID=3240934 RepID=UPI003512AFEC
MALGRHVAGMVMCATALVGTSVGWVPSAQAHGGEAVVCAGRESIAFSPGLTLASRPTDVTARAAYRCGGSGAPGQVLTAEGRLSAHSPESTCVTLNSGRARETVRYGDGSASEITYTRSSAGRVAGLTVVRMTGTVTEGRGKGSAADRTIALLPHTLPTACLTPEGLQQAAGRVQLEIHP